MALAPARLSALEHGLGYFAKIVGRKRSSVADTLGLLLAVLVTAVSVQDSIAGTHFLDQFAADHPGIRSLGRRRLPTPPRRARGRLAHIAHDRPHGPPPHR